MMAERGFSAENMPDAVDSGATGHCVRCQPWMRRGRYDSDSDESSDSKSSMPTLIPRAEADDRSSDEESDWTSTTEEVTDDESVMSHEIDAQNEDIIQIDNIWAVSSRQFGKSMTQPLHEGPG